jgi:hypothetical protein
MAIIRSHNFDSLAVNQTPADNVIQQKQSLSPSTNIVAVDNFGYTNNSSIKTVLDYSLGLNNGNWRAEARWGSDTSLWEVWHSFVFYIPENYVMDSIEETIHQQFGGAGGAGSPAFSLRLDATRLIVRHVFGVFGVSGSQNITTYKTPISKQTWNKVTYKIGFYPDSTGYLKVWLNRELIYTYNGKIHYEGSPTPPTSHKVGIYDSTRSSSSSPSGFTSRTLFYDEYRIANTEDGDWETFIALDADGLPALSGIEPPIPPDPTEGFRARLRFPNNPIV